MARISFNPASITRGAAPDIFAVVREAAEKLADAMRARVPVNKGKLRESIRVEKGRQALEYLVKAGGPLTTKDGYDYAIATEFGTKKEQAEPFFWNTYRAARNSTRAVMRERISNAITRSAQRNGDG